MESYSQPWTVINKYEKDGEVSKTYFVPSCSSKPEYYERLEKSEYYGKPEGHYKPEYYGKYEKPEGQYRPEYYGKSEGHYKPEYYGKYEKPEYYGKYEKPEYYGKYEKPEYYGKYEKPEYYGKYEKPEYYGKYDKTEQYGLDREIYQHNKPHWQLEKVCGDWEKICEKLERNNLNETPRSYWQQNKDCCCDEETVKMIKELITILVGAEQSYIQLGFLCMDEKFTLVNTSEYFRLCGLRLRWIANGLIRRSVRLFNVNEWVNNTHFENWFKVPTKDELATNDYTNIMKSLFKIVLDAEHRIGERMNILGEKMTKVDWMNTECKFDGFKWFLNFVLPYQTHFLREIKGHFKNIEMCDNGYIFDKCEMFPLVQKIEEFIQQLSKVNTTHPLNKMMTEKRYL